MELRGFLDGATHVVIGCKIPDRLELSVCGVVSNDLAQPARCFDRVFQFDGDGFMAIEVKQTIWEMALRSSLADQVRTKAPLGREATARLGRQLLRQVDQHGVVEIRDAIDRLRRLQMIA